VNNGVIKVQNSRCGAAHSGLS